MGSPLRLTTVGLDEVRAERAWSIASSDMERTEAVLSRFRDASDLTALNRLVGGDWQPVDRRLYLMLAAAARAQRLTDGRFDPRVLGHLEALGEHGAFLPGRGDGRPSSDRTWLERAPRRREVRVAVPVDSGGIGKGLGLRWAVNAIEAAGIRASGLLLEAGGDVAVRGRAPDGAWRIGIEDPRGRAEPIGVLESPEGAVATSSVAVRHWIGPTGGSVHHLIDPASGQPGGHGLLAVTVRAADPAWAEVWSKALFLAGRSQIGAEARRRQMEAWWVEDDGSLHMTPAARSRTVWTREEGFLDASAA